MGLSGLTEYPHLHFTVRHNGKVIDPFRGEKDGAECEPLAPLWRPEVPDAAAVRSGRFRKAGTLDGAAPVLVFYVDVFGVGPGDVLELRVTAPDGKTLAEQRTRLELRQARRFGAVGKRRSADAWPPGRYRGEARLIRADGRQSQWSERTVTIDVEAAKK